jgi:hypothetical protein
MSVWPLFVAAERQDSERAGRTSDYSKLLHGNYAGNLASEHVIAAVVAVCN